MSGRARRGGRGKGAGLPFLEQGQQQGEGAGQGGVAGGGQGGEQEIARLLDQARDGLLP
jgi:hypothetical protein